MKKNITDLDYVKLLNSSSAPEFTATSFEYDKEEISHLNYNEKGLIPAIVQDRTTGHVLMMAWMNEEALTKTLETGRTWFFSRSRNEYWQKGETSGDRQYVRGVFYDCDEDVILVVADQEGSGACHTGSWSCFYRELSNKIF